MSEKKFEAGSSASWTSKRTGITKTVKVAAVVPPGTTPSECIDVKRYNVSRADVFCKRSKTRDHESYLVELPSDGKGRAFVFWPPVANLAY